MKNLKLVGPILAAVSAAAACAQVEPVVDDDYDDLCRMEMPMGSHIKEEDCVQESDAARMAHEIEGIFGDIIREPVQVQKDLPEGTCGSQ